MDSHKDQKESRGYTEVGGKPDGYDEKERTTWEDPLESRRREKKYWQRSGEFRKRKRYPVRPKKKKGRQACDPRAERDRRRKTRVRAPSKRGRTKKLAPGRRPDLKGEKPAPLRSQKVTWIVERMGVSRPIIPQKMSGKDDNSRVRGKENPLEGLGQRISSQQSRQSDPVGQKFRALAFNGERVRRTANDPR